MEDKLKHIELIQGVINRMAQNSFFIKGWLVTLVSALCALAAKDSNQIFISIAYFPTIAFWLLDSYYLYQERMYRKLYDEIRKKQTSDFSMSTKHLGKLYIDWPCATLSITMLLFYGIIFFTLIYLLKF